MGQRIKAALNEKVPNVAGIAPATDAPAVVPDGDVVRAARIESLEGALKQMEQIDESDPAKKVLLDQLREARQAQRSSKPVLQQRTNVAFRL
eukprot:8960376-Pyramimonas_sp.AAC.1